jgi:hypothetical protein
MRESDYISLKEHFEKLLCEMDKRYCQRFEAQQAAVSAALTSSSAAVDKAEINAEKWRNNANEWRGAMNDKDKKVAETMMGRTEYRAEHENLMRRVDNLESAKDIATGRSSISVFISILALIVAAIKLFIK